jgi:hypothetical protein
MAAAMLVVATLATTNVYGAEQDDKAKAQQIATVLRDSGKLQGYSIGVKYKDGTAWLAGRVTTKEQAASALQVVSNIEGVEQIVNNLTIAPSDSSGKSSARKASPAAPVAPAIPPQFDGGESQAAAIQLATANQMAAQQQIAPAAGYKQMPPANFNPQAAAQPMPGYGRPLPAYQPNMGGAIARATYDQAHMPNYAWPSYAAYPNYSALTYPKQYSASAWPFIGPFYPYPQVPLGWRRVSLEWDDGWWHLDFHDRGCQ